ncbi:MAG: hypothetical protein JSS20_22135, partial [Proteobacteria bacterium]|nr:hypothetical protein [Pseudomonadota bacterium]
MPVLLACSLLVSRPAESSGRESVAMPFTCQVQGGRVRLERSPERTYQVIGPRERQAMRICSGARHSFCRVLDLHRFRFDCNGVPASWMEAAASTGNGMRWRTAFEPGRNSVALRRDGAVSYREPPVMLPPGFAPAPLAGLRFISGHVAPPVAAESAPPVPAPLPAPAVAEPFPLPAPPPAASPVEDLAPAPLPFAAPKLILAEERTSTLPPQARETATAEPEAAAPSDTAAAATGPWSATV